MNLPLHLVLDAVRRRAQTSGANYADVLELVSDLLPSACAAENQEVPMETDQLEEALMMNGPVVKKALQKGVPDTNEKKTTNISITVSY